MSTELLFRDDAYAKTASARVVAVDERGIELDRTIFYPVGGGQQGDAGTLLRADGERIAIVDTRKGDTMDSVRHIAAPATASTRAGRNGRARARLDAPLCADAPAYGAARHVVRRGGAGDGRQHCPRQGPPRFRHRHEPPRRRQDRARDERADRARRRDGDRLDHRRGARRASRAREDDERAAAARRRAGCASCAFPGSTCSPAAARTCATSPRSERSACSRFAAKAGAIGASRLRWQARAGGRRGNGDDERDGAAAFDPARRRADASAACC